MKALRYFELDLPRCANTYGTAPCTASLGVTGNDKCFNSRATCQDLANFRPGRPDVESVTGTAFSSDTTAHVATMPSSIGAGDLLLALFANDANTAVTTPSGWTLLGALAHSTDVNASLFAKVADGTENTPPTFSANLRTNGSAIGDMTSGGGLAAAFDNTTNSTQAASANKGGVLQCYIGRSFSSAKRIYSVTIYGSNDVGFVSGGNPNLTVVIRGKHGAAPASRTDGTQIGTLTFADTSNESAGRSITITDQTTAWDHVWADLSYPPGVAATMSMAELAIFEATGALGGFESFVTASAEAAAIQIFQVLANNWDGALATGVAIQFFDPGGASTAPDPAEIDPGWGSFPTLWIAAFLASSVSAVTEYPISFANGLNTLGGTTTTGASVSSAYLVSTAESVDPGPFSIASTIGVCLTIGVKQKQNVTLRFSKPADYLPKTIDALANIVSIEHTPAIVGLGDNLGERASLKVTFKDEPHSDTGPGYDPYRLDRSYDPFSQGTHWGKFRARNPFVQGSECRLYSGELGESLESMEERAFIVESSSGPGMDGKFSITAKDFLKLLDGDRAQAPAANTGRLSGAINAAVTAATLVPAGIGDTEYAASGYICIGGNEICSFTRVADALTITRGQLGTTAATHNADDRVQTVLRYSGSDVADIISDLLGTYAGVPTQFIPLSTWRTETSAFLNTVYTGTIPEPTAVKALVSELIEQAGLCVWQSDDPTQINLQVLRTVASSAATIDESYILKGTLQISDQPDKRASQIWTFFAQRDPTKKLDELSNYASVAVTIDTDAEADYGTPAIRKIYSRWIPTGGLTVAEALNDILLSRYRRPPRKFSFKLSDVTGPFVTPGSGYRVAATPIQDEFGAADSIPIQATSVKREDDGITVTAEELQIATTTTGDDVIILSTSDTNVNLQTLHDQIYPVAVSGDNVVCYVGAGVVIGSTSTGSPAFDVGSFATGVNVYLIVEGRIQGAGGNGGKGAAKNPPPNGVDGSDGGTALFTRQAVNVDASLGSIWGGGGGGGGGGANTSFSGGGGGGGAGSSVAGRSGNGGAGGDGQSGDTGTPTAGGAGGVSSSGDGGDGGDPGSNGHAGAAPSSAAGAGGNAGSATDGDSFITYGTYSSPTFTPGATGTEDIRGPEVN